MKWFIFRVLVYLLLLLLVIFTGNVVSTQKRSLALEKASIHLSNGSSEGPGHEITITNPLEISVRSVDNE